MPIKLEEYDRMSSIQKINNPIRIIKFVIKKERKKKNRLQNDQAKKPTTTCIKCVT